MTDKREAPPAPTRSTWRPPTRRAFVAMLGAAAAALALPRTPPKPASKPRWIGHC